VELSLVDSDLVGFVSKADSYYKEAGFKEGDKFGLLRNAIRSNHTLMQFILLRSPKGYTEFKKTIIDFEKAKDVYGAEDTVTFKPRDMKMPEQSLDSRIESLTAQLSDLNRMVKKLKEEEEERPPVYGHARFARKKDFTLDAVNSIPKRIFNVPVARSMGIAPQSAGPQNRSRMNVEVKQLLFPMNLKGV
jgi:hypothetical protein